MRARNLKPGLFKNEDLGTADPFLTILFEGLWCLADKEGRLEDRPMRIKAEIFPYRNFIEKKVDSLLDDLRQMHLIRRYKVAGQAIIQVLKFTKHQSPHNTEKDSELSAEPLILEADTEITKTIPLDSDALTDEERSDSLIPDSLNTDLLNDETPQQVAVRIFEYWQTVHKKPRAQFTTDRRTKVMDRIKDSSPTEIFLAIDGCRKSKYHQGVNETQTVYDDLELICRTRRHLERFVEFASNGNGHKPDAGRPAEEPAETYNCSKCFDSGKIMVPDPDGEFEWTMKENECEECQLLAA